LVLFEPLRVFLAQIFIAFATFYFCFQARNLRVASLKRLEENANANPIPDENHPVNVVKGAKSKGSLKDKIDVALENVHHYSTDTGSPNQIRFQSTVAWYVTSKILPVLDLKNRTLIDA